MSGVLSGFYIVWAIIAVGWAVGRTGVLGENSRLVLNRVTFFVCSPALVLTALLDSDPASIVGPAFWVAGISGLIAGAILVALVRLLTARRGADVVITAISGSVVNGANMGFPIAAYVLGDVSHALPVILFQQAVFTPLYLFVLHAVTSGDRPSVTAVVRNIAANPTIIATAVGMALVLAGVPIPEVALEPVVTLAQMAIPAMLLAFGISLIGARPLSAGEGYRGLILLATAAKLALMPAVALGLGLLWGLQGHALFAVVVMAALPTAQNVFVAASRYGAAEPLARDTVLVTTVGTVLTLLLISAVLA
ncbi:AEC family transporter [Brachybacterium timonense]|uniref:AEC family transporter n=1 Tax=Brachybacterium timonense TaxID=2050896 RepID=UPI000D0B14FC|nr:AEC family transporter [Brachybacterium timonense]